MISTLQRRNYIHNLKFSSAAVSSAVACGFQADRCTTDIQRIIVDITVHRSVVHQCIELMPHISKLQTENLALIPA